MLVIKVKGIAAARREFRRLAKEFPKAAQKGELRVARSIQMKARNIIDSETIAHTGLLRSDVRIKPRGKHYNVVAGEHAPYAYLIEHGRKAIMGYVFVPTQLFPLEGYARPSPTGMIREAKGIKFMFRATQHARTKVVNIVESELKKVIR